ncbi:MAG: IniB N-terminal domain-containing protein [Mycobacterium sp.]
MTSAISSLLDWLMDLARPGADPQDVRAFLNSPTQAASQAMGTTVTQAQLTQAAHAVVGPSAVAGGNPIQHLQNSVADTHGIAFAPQRVFAPETAVASHNDIGSPRAGEDVQQGVGNVDLDFDFSRDINASDGAVVNQGTIGGDVDTTNVEGDGNIVGDDNEGANTGDVTAGQGSNVQAGGKDNDLVDTGDDVNTQAGGDVATNTGSGQNTQVGDIDASGGGAAGGAGGNAGGGLLGIGNDGGDGGAAAGGAGGPVIIAPTQNTNSNNDVGGDQTNVSGTVGGDVDASHDDNSVDNSNQDNSTTDNSGQVNTDVDVSTNVDAGLF